MPPDADYHERLKDYFGPAAYEQKVREHHEAALREVRRRQIRTRVAVWSIASGIAALVLALFLIVVGF